MKRKYMMLSALYGMMFLAAFTVTSCGKDELSVSTVKESEETTETTTEELTETTMEATAETPVETSQDEKVSVYVCGAVQQEGVYTLDADSRIQDALDMAGGYSEDAAHGVINLAEKLTDGMQIYFPTEQEISETGGLPNGTEKDNWVASRGSDGEQDSTLVNINTADAETLKTLPGIGDSKAKDIISYRDSNGPFGDVQDIKNVSGIGESTFEKLKPYITVK